MLVDMSVDKSVDIRVDCQPKDITAKSHLRANQVAQSGQRLVFIHPSYVLNNYPGVSMSSRCQLAASRQTAEIGTVCVNNLT